MKLEAFYYPVREQCDNCKDWITRYEYRKNQGLCNECINGHKPKYEG